MNNAQCGIAVLHRADDDADREQVVDLVDRLVLVHHLFIDAEEVFDAAVDFALNAGLLEAFTDVFGDLIDIGLALGFALGDLLHKVKINIGLEVF